MCMQSLCLLFSYPFQNEDILIYIKSNYVNIFQINIKDKMRKKVNAPNEFTGNVEDDEGAPNTSPEEKLAYANICMSMPV